MMRFKTLFPTLLAGLIAAACGHGHDHGPTGEDDGHSHAAPHGGHVVDVGAGIAHLEVLHDDAAGTVTVYVLGKDVKTAVALAKPMTLKLATDEGPEELTGELLADHEPANSAFSWTSPALEGEGATGRFSLELDGKSYSPDFEHDH